VASRAAELIRSLRLEAHPEGGYYREFFRAAENVQPGDGRPSRAALSAIYFLLKAGQRSRWHRVRSDEQWTLLDGDSLELLVIGTDFKLTRHRLNPDEPATRSVVVPGGAWQAALSGGEYSLVTCTVGPGFEFDDFDFMTDDMDASRRLRAEYPDLLDWLE
jgi:predicted cupin superfamily sugar epimerase